MIPITDERPSDADAIEALLDTCFGPGRTAKTVYRLRAGVDPAPGLSRSRGTGRTLWSARSADGRFGLARTRAPRCCWDPWRSTRRSRDAASAAP